MPTAKAKEPEIRKPLRRYAKTGIDTGKGKTEQSHKKQCDINYILRDYHASGMIKHAAKYEGKYDDVTVQDFQEAMFIVKNAQTMFEDLPANLRNRFGNDPAAFLNFVQNPDNSEEMHKMGIIKGNDGIDISGAATGAPQQKPLDLQGSTEPPAERQ